MNFITILVVGANDGFINIGVSGGTPPYSFIWSNGSNTPTIDNLSPGNYSLTVTDNNNCFQEIKTLIQEPQPLTFELIHLMSPLVLVIKLGQHI